MATRKPNKSKTPRRASGGTVMPTPQEVEVMVTAEGDEEFEMAPFDAQSGTIEIPLPDGSLEIDLNPQPVDTPKSSKFDDNLAEHLDYHTLSGISNQLLDAIDEDDRDRSEWITTRSDGIDLLGLKVEKPGTGNVGTSSTAVPGQSTVRDPVMLEAVLRFQANAFGELCPSEGPCKAVNFGDATTEADQMAEELEKDFNFFLTTTAKEYYPDTRRMLFWTGYASGMFKKVYRCPLRQRPVSESIDGSDLIIPSNVTDLHNAGRITHQINMRQATMKRMQILGVYRNIELSTPVQVLNQLQEKTAEVTGMDANRQRPEDQDYTIYECYCELDIKGFEHKKNGKVTGLPLPYRVTMDKDSREVLEIRRNWREDDEDAQAKIPFVAFPYATGLGIYGVGLLHILGNLTMALTAMLRECIDAGMFASFPGFLYAKGAGRQLQNEFRVPPGGGAPIDTGMMPLRDAIMPLPYKDVSTAMVALIQQTREVASRVGNMAEAPVGEGRQDAPVGTTLAMIEQSTKIEGGVHKALHAAQTEELQLLKDLFLEDPESLWRGNRRPAMGKDLTTRLTKFKKALADCEIVPASDPNVPSHMHRLAKAASLKQLTAGNPKYNDIAVDRRIASMMKIDDFDALLAPPQQGAPDPTQLLAEIEKMKIMVAEKKVMVEAQKAQWQNEQATADRESQREIEATKLALGQKPEAGPAPPDPFKAAELALEQEGQMLDRIKVMLEAQNKKEDREAKLAVEAMKIANTVGIHPEADAQVDQQLNQMSAFIQPAAKGSADGGPVKAEEEAMDLDAVLDAIEWADRARQITAALNQKPSGPLQ